MYNLIFILGIDALDYELVEKWNLKNLKQLEYNKIEVPINEKTGVPWSPEVWASFLTGRNVSIKFTKDSLFVKIILWLIEFFNVDWVNFQKNFLGMKIKSFGKKIGFKGPTRFRTLRQKTFLDIISSIEVNVPYYNFDNSTFDLLYLYGDNKLSLNKLIKEMKIIYDHRKIQILKEIKKIENADVFFAYIHVTDDLQHLLFLHISEIRQHYIDLDNYISILKRKIEDSFEEVIIIIISDHGFDFNRGTHSKHGFYSSNINLIPKPEKITDFYGIILDIVSKQDKRSKL